VQNIPKLIHKQTYNNINISKLQYAEILGVNLLNNILLANKNNLHDRNHHPQRPTHKCKANGIKRIYFIPVCSS